MSKVFIIFLILFGSHMSQGAVWESPNTWSPYWEDQFSEWVSKHWTESIFIHEKSPYRGIKTDCADATMGMRAVFAFENGLPFSYRDPSQFGKAINNEIQRWDHLPPIERFKKFMALVSQTVSTRSLPESSLPVAINSKDFRPGIFFVKPDKHSYQIQDINKYGIPITMSSTVPYKVRYFDKYEAFPAYNIEDVKSYRDGYRRFLLEAELYAPKPELPGYSLEQFEIAIDQGFDTHLMNSVFREAISDGTKEPLPQKIERMMINLCNASRNRVDYVYSSIKAQQKIASAGRQCMNAAEYDNYSTNSRDQRFANYFFQVRDVVRSSAFKRARKTPIMRYAKELFSEKNPRVSREDFVNWCHVEHRPNQDLSVRRIWLNVLRGKIVSDPNATIDQRWGLGSKPFTPQCPVY